MANTWIKNRNRYELQSTLDDIKKLLRLKNKLQKSNSFHENSTRRLAPCGPRKEERYREKMKEIRAEKERERKTQLK